MQIIHHYAPLAGALAAIGTVAIPAWVLVVEAPWRRPAPAAAVGRQRPVPAATAADAEGVTEPVQRERRRPAA